MEQLLPCPALATKFEARDLLHWPLCVASLVPGLAPVLKDYWGRASALGAGGR